MKEVRDNPSEYGLKGYRDWEQWCMEKCDIPRRSANRFIQAFEELGSTSTQLSTSKIFEMLSLPQDIDRQEFIKQKHTIPSTGEQKTVDEMTERRGQAETDPIKKARIAQFLKEYWGINHGNNQYNRSGQNDHSKTRQDIADAIGEDDRTTRRILKLNDLIPELQTLVSQGKLGTTAAEQLAYLSEDEQHALLSVKGSLEGTTVKQHLLN